MTPWSLGALVLLVALVPCGFLVVRAPHEDALVALQLAGTIAVLALVLLCEAFGRPSYFDVPMTLAPLTAIGGMLFARFLPVRKKTRR